MKKDILIASIILSMFVAFHACTEQGIESSHSRTESSNLVGEADLSNREIENPFQKNVGEPINAKIGMQWIENYLKAKTYTETSYNIDATMLSGIISHPDCSGVSFKYALDANMKPHIIPVGIDSDGREMRTERIYTSLGSLSWEEGREMYSRFDGKIKSHYFGIDIIKRIIEHEHWNVIVLNFAFDDAGNPLLLLTSQNSLDTNSLVIDSSVPCPPVCPTTAK